MKIERNNKKYKVYRVNSFKMKLGKELNKLKNPKLKKRCIQFVAGLVVVTTLGFAMVSYNVDAAQKTEYEVYTVVQGDTLSKIADKYEIEVETLIEYNNIQNPNLIEIGQEIKIPTEENVEEEKIIDKEAIVNKWNDDLEKKGYVQGIDFAYDATNKNIDLEKVLEENPQIKYVIVRSNYFFTKTSCDKKIVEYAKIAKEKDVAFGIYYWPTFRGLEKTKQEIDIIMEKVKELEENNCYLTLPIFMDIETKDAGGADVCERISRKHKETLDCFKYTVDYFKNNGYKLMLYTGNNTIPYGVHNLAQEQGVELWISHYGRHNGMHIDDSIDVVKFYEKSPHVIRQYSEGYVDGFKGDVDLNLAYKNIPEEIFENKLNNTDEIKTESSVKKFFKSLF